MATRNVSPPPDGEDESPAVEAAPPGRPPRDRPLVTITVVRGSLSQAEAPVAVAARYRGLPIAGPAKEFDYVLKFWLTRALELGMIGSGLGELFRVPLTRRKEAGAVKADELLLVGMGEPGYFGADDLRFLMTNVTVAVKARRLERFSVSLIGSRRGEMSVELAARGFLDGVNDGYDRCRGMLDGMGTDRERFLDAFFGDLEIVLVEREKSRKEEIFQAFSQLGQERSLLEHIALEVRDGGEIPVLKMKGEDSPDLPPAEERSTLIRVTLPPPRTDAAPASMPEGTTVFQYSALSQTSTIPVREMRANPYFARTLPERLRTARTTIEEEDFGRLWANYLVPEEFHRIIEGSDHLTLVLDESTACFPWEMVAFRKWSSTRFLGIDYQLTRMFRTILSAVPGMPPPLNRNLRVLIVADPAPGDLALPHARAEGLAVLAALRHAQERWGKVYDIKATVRIGSHREGDLAGEVLEAARAAREVVESVEPCDPPKLLALLVNNAYDVVHYAGHGEFSPSTGRMGWMFEWDCILSAEDIFQVRQVPRLVFANACFSAATSDYDRQRQRVGLAQAFFARGIQNYIGTGWEVQDESAQVLAARFYSQALGIVRKDGGDEVYETAPPATLGNSLANARRAIVGRGTTWGAYQHYGQASAKLLPFRNAPTRKG